MNQSQKDKYPMCALIKDDIHRKYFKKIEVISELKDVMQPRVSGIKENQQNAFILQNKS